jgi:hypothetical protein
MGPLLVNTKQKVAVLASGLAIAATGLVGPSGAAAASASSGDDHPADPPPTQQPLDDR